MIVVADDACERLLDEDEEVAEATRVLQMRGLVQLPQAKRSTRIWKPRASVVCSVRCGTRSRARADHTASTPGVRRVLGPHGEPSTSTGATPGACPVSRTREDSELRTAASGVGHLRSRSSLLAIQQQSRFVARSPTATTPESVSAAAPVVALDRSWFQGGGLAVGHGLLTPLGFAAFAPNDLAEAARITFAPVVLTIVAGDVRPGARGAAVERRRRR